MLTDAMSERLLRRASELDAAARSGAKVTELRDAAAEAGISSEAFDAALAELKGAVPATVPQTSGRSKQRVWASALIAGAVAVMAFATLLVGRSQPRVPAGQVEQVIQLRCLTNTEAITLLRPLVAREPHGLFSSNSSNRVLRVRSSPERMREIQALLDKHDGADATSCQISPLPTKR